MKIGRERSVFTYGNYFILNLTFTLIPKDQILNLSSGFDEYLSNVLPHLIKKLTDKTFEHVERKYPSALIHQLFRNYTRCRDLKSGIIEEFKSLGQEPLGS